VEFDLRQLRAREGYKLLTGLIVPRPIALVTTQDAEGNINAAPFSFFNMLGSDPPVIGLGVGERRPGECKDTAGNIARSGEFVVNIVDEALAERMNITAIDFPPGSDELAAAGLTTRSSAQVAPPRIAESPAGLECRAVSTIDVGRNRILLAEVLYLHVRDDLVDTMNGYVHADRLRAIGRLHGGGWYARTTDLFEMPRLTYEQWQAGK